MFKKLFKNIFILIMGGKPNAKENTGDSYNLPQME